MAPLKPHWVQPSHAEIQDVIINEREFTSKSLSKISLPPFGLYAKMAFPPCTFAESPTYATVQCGRDRHLNLNSDLLYINHSCEPSLFFDTATFNIIAGPNGLRVGEELTFFYPSTEWAMAQPFDCLCNKPSCRGRIAGARDMTPAQLNGVWLNGHIHELLEERDGRRKALGDKPGSINGTGPPVVDHSDGTADDGVARVLRDVLTNAEKALEAMKSALRTYPNPAAREGTSAASEAAGASAPDEALVRALQNIMADAEKARETTKSVLSLYLDHATRAGAAADGAGATFVAGLARRGVTSRELSGEMGGDTPAASGS
ncbi:hypothetical protein GGS23DRAFT_98465 [Durotheca rogersii]|uniref:uncharacterized protein n=1 Tax=Durotheca rogersii TaxID=419775 RepID=UPI00221F162E|nr:uncharacterized protein GGS23DRAFT_98465 [Durotheca rogersii]KAI5862394.1 hypothetical protein GGS23DRAFT_98465 [Durotheca rogersii]